MYFHALVSGLGSNNTRQSTKAPAHYFTESFSGVLNATDCIRDRQSTFHGKCSTNLPGSDRYKMGSPVRTSRLEAVYSSPLESNSKFSSPQSSSGLQRLQSDNPRLRSHTGNHTGLCWTQCTSAQLLGWSRTQQALDNSRAVSQARSGWRGAHRAQRAKVIASCSDRAAHGSYPRLFQLHSEDIWCQRLSYMGALRQNASACGGAKKRSRDRTRASWAAKGTSSRRSEESNRGLSEVS